MKKISCLVLLALLGCGSNQPKQDVNTKDNYPTAEQFLALFQDVNDKTLHIYPVVDMPDGKKFMGVKLDSAFLKFLDDSTYILNIANVKQGMYGLFACYKIPITPSIIGLITRVPSQYDESAIDLFLWDSTVQKIVGSFELADSFGDEGWYFEKESWISVDKPTMIQIVTRQKDHNPTDEDNSTFTVSDTIKFYRLNNTKFIQEYPEVVDSSKYTLKYWK